MKNVECSIEGTMNAASRDELEISGLVSAVRIAAELIERSDNGFSFGLSGSYKLPYSWATNFGTIINAMVLTVEQPSCGALGAMRLGDPDIRPEIPNFTGQLREGSPSDGYFGGTFGLRIRADGEFEPEQAIYLRVCLQPIISNCVTLELKGKSVGSSGGL